MPEPWGKTEDNGRLRFERVVRDLEGFGHRGSGTEFEDRAADYLIGELGKLHVDAAKEEFSGYTALGARVLVHVAVAAFGMFFILKLPLVTLLLGGLVLVSFVGEMTTRFILLSRLLPAARSRNVAGTIPAHGEGGAKKRMVICAHYDTQRTGIIWRGKLTKRMAVVCQMMPGPAKSPLFPVVLAFVVQPVAALAAWFWPDNTATLIASAYILFAYAVAGVLLAEWAVGRFVPGAADNATGTAAAIELADRWRRAPVEGVELVILLTGCEETGALGAAAWVQAHQNDRQYSSTAFLVLDTLAYGAPRFLGAEYTLAATPVRYRPDMIRLCDEAARRLGIRGAGPLTAPTFTDATPFVMHKIPGISILTFEDGVYMPNYHQMSDTSENLSFDVAWQAVDFSWEVLKELAKH